MASQSARSSSAAPWALTALVMLGAGAVVFLGLDALKDEQTKTEQMRVERDQALAQVKQLTVALSKDVGSRPDAGAP